MAKKKSKKRTKEQIIKRMNKIGFTTRFCNSSCPAKKREKIGKIDKKNRTIPFIMISADNAGERYDWWTGETFTEELDINGANTDQLRTFFKDHIIYVDNAIGRVLNPRVEEDLLICDVIFGKDEDSDRVFKKYIDGTLNDVSIGYHIRDIVVTEKEDEPTHILVTKFDIRELSAVGIGFDRGAGRSKTEKGGNKHKKRDKKRVKNFKKDEKSLKKHKKREKTLKKESEKLTDVELLQKKLDLKGKK